MDLFPCLTDASAVACDQSIDMQTDDSEMTIAKLSALTPAEQAVLDQALTGVTAREIAEHLSLSEATVRSHLSSIYVKLGVSGRVALLAHFRGSETVLPHAETPAPPPAARSVRGRLELGNPRRPRGCVCGVSADLGPDIRRLADDLAAGVRVRGSLGLWDNPRACDSGAGVARLMTVSSWAAVGLLAFAIRGLFLGPVPPFLMLGAAAVAIGWISYRAKGSLQH